MENKWSFISYIPIFVHVASNNFWLPFVVICGRGSRLFLFLVEKFVYLVWLNLLPVYDVCVATILLCFHILCSTHFWSLSQQRVVFFLYVHAVAFLVVVTQQFSSIFRRAPRLFLNPVFVDGFIYFLLVFCFFSFWGLWLPEDAADWCMGACVSFFFGLAVN